jgi:Rrf2 family iron-sulfur cluster assembly transcriptional regulator
MKLTTKGRYAVTAMLDLALHDVDGPVALADISERQAISLSYLEQLFSKLRRNGLVISTRGPGGGYTLSKGPSRINVSSIISAVDENVDATRCGGQGNCQDDTVCLSHDLWSTLSKQIRDFLEEITLGSLMESNGVKVVSKRQDVKQSKQKKFSKLSLNSLVVE